MSYRRILAYLLYQHALEVFYTAMCIYGYCGAVDLYPVLRTRVYNDYFASKNGDHIFVDAVDRAFHHFVDVWGRP